LTVASGLLKEADKIRIDGKAKIIYLGTGEQGVWRGIIDYSSANPAIVEITGVSFSEVVKQGKEFKIIVSLDNLGGKSASLPIELRVGDKDFEKTVNLDSADQTAAQFDLKLSEEGKYPVYVNGIIYGEIIVLGEEVDRPLNFTDLFRKLFWPIFWIIFVIVAIVVGKKIAPLIYRAIRK
jgi:PAS domain-containing protein